MYSGSEKEQVNIVYSEHFWTYFFVYFYSIVL